MTASCAAHDSAPPGRVDPGFGELMRTSKEVLTPGYRLRISGARSKKTEAPPVAVPARA